MAEENNLEKNPKDQDGNGQLKIDLNGSGSLFATETVNNDPKDFAPINKYLFHKPLTYGKKLYIGEFIAERVIQAIAITSIGFIIAIFYYVFHEASYAFITPEKAKVENISSTINQNSNQQETYNSGSSSSAENDASLKPDSYGSTPVDTKTTQAQESSTDESNKPDTYNPDSNTPEQYNPDNTSAPVVPKAPASSLESGRLASQSSESAGQNSAITIKQLVAPNDKINGKNTYIWQPIGGVPKYSLIPLALGALKVTLIGLLFAAPLAILAAIFTTAFAPRWLKEIMKPIIEILAGFPSVVLGFFCLITLATVIQKLFGTTYRLNSFVGGIGMALAVIPIIYTITEDALSAIPKYMKEASLALGASRWQTAYRVVLPAATPGVFAAIILGFGRAFGETMIALMATGNAAIMSTNIFDSVRTMAATIGAEMAEVEFHGVHYGILFLIGAILFVVTFSLNAIAEFYVRKRLLKKFQGN